MFRNKPGVYMIRNKTNGRIYIGGAVNVSSRIAHHKDSLNKGLHDNRFLQKDWSKFGKTGFDFSILEYTDENDPRKREQFFISKFSNEGSTLYNISKSAFGNHGIKQPETFFIKRRETINKWTQERRKSFIEKCRALWTPERREYQSDAVKAYRKKTRGDFVYRFISPDGKKIEIQNLKEFCGKNGLDTSAMLKVHKGAYGRNSHKGWSKA